MPKHLNLQGSTSASLPFWLLSNLSSVPKMMKNRASTFLKQVFELIVTMVKAKSTAVKSKTSAIKTRLLVFGLIRNKKVLMTAISHKIHALIGQEKGGEGASRAEDYSKAIVLYNEAKEESSPPNPASTEIVECGEDDDDDYPDLRHSLFDLEDEDEDGDDGTGSVVDLVRNSREDGSGFVLEDEIDHVADVFIRRFHKQMRMQKLNSFKRYQEMLERSV